MQFLRLGRTSRVHEDIKPYADEVLAKSHKTVSSLAKFYEDQVCIR